jgi:hypothetical protein
VPECVDEDGFAVTCVTPDAVELWPESFQPASGISSTRDSTDWLGLTVPGSQSGHELFKAVDVVTAGGQSRRLYAAYNAGIQVWDISAGSAASPLRLAVRDGWEGDFISFPDPEVGALEFVEDVAALGVGTEDLAALAAIDPVGPTLWEFDPDASTFALLYQDSANSSRKIQIAQIDDGNVYAFAATSDGVAVYNVSAARALVAPCFDTQSHACPGVFRGLLPGMTTGRWVDVLYVPVIDRLLVAASDGSTTSAGIWQVDDPEDPAGSSIQRFDGGADLVGARGLQMFSHDGHFYLALVRQKQLRILLIDDCLFGPGCFLGAGSVVDAVDPIALRNLATTEDILSYSTVNREPLLYYGVAAQGLSGPDVDQLFDLASLSPPDPLPLAGLPEITASGGAYVDPCNSSTIRYWSHYYSENAHGLNNVSPRVGKFARNGYFYRAAETILDVHLLGDGVTPAPSSLTTSVTPPQAEHWMSDEIAFAAAATGCTPAAPSWVWSASTTEPDVAPVQLTEVTDTSSYRFDCTAAGRCPDALVTVWAANGSCPSADLAPASFVVKDPAIDIVSIDSGGTGVFDISETVPLSAELLGRGPIWWAWRVGGSTPAECSSTLPGTDLSAAAVPCSASAAEAFQQTIFVDGFESGDTSRWGAPTGGKAVVAELFVWDSADTSLSPQAVERVTFTITE